MLTEDYIMRMINQALAVIMTALGLKRSRQLTEALQTFDQALEILLGLNANLANQLDESALLDKLTFQGKLDMDRLLVLADIYREEAEIYSLQGQPQSSRFAAQRSLRFYLESVLASEAINDLELVQKIESLRLKLDAAALPGETRLALMDYVDRLLGSSDGFLTEARLSRSGLQATISLLDRLQKYS
jgi:hypothetical protein